MLLTFCHLSRLKIEWDSKYQLTNGFFSKVSSEENTPKLLRTSFLTQFHGSLSTFPPQRQESRQPPRHRFQPIPHKHKLRRQRTPKNPRNPNPLPRQLSLRPTRKLIRFLIIITRQTINERRRPISKPLKVQRRITNKIITKNSRQSGRQIKPTRKYLLHVGNALILRRRRRMRRQDLIRSHLSRRQLNAI